MPASPGERFMRMRGDGEGLLSGAARRLSRIRIPFKSPSLLDRSAPYFSGIKRFGISKFNHYWQDPFHTLLNLPWGRFIAIFFLTYLLEFMIFAFLFWAMSDRCIIGMEGKFAHALWMSSRTASTLGYDQIHPNPECTLTNLTVMLQVIASSLVNFIMLGLVFARFSAPFKRASTIRFSSVMVCYQHPSGHWCLSLRVANIRKHQILKPSVRMVLTAVDSITPSNYLFEHLAIEGHSTQETNLELGFPANVTHIITPASPLYNLSLLEMDTRMMEILVFVDGIDAMTSKNMSARHAYNTNEVHLNEHFQPLHLEMRGGSLGLDFSGFDLTTLASLELLAEYNAEPGLADRPLPEVQSHLWHLRHMTFKRLTERDHNHALGVQDPNSAQALGALQGPGAAAAAAATHGSPYRSGLPTSSSAVAHGRIDGPLGSGGGGSNNPFATPSGAAAAAAAPISGGSIAARGSGGGASGSTWMGFGVTLHPTAAPPPPPPSSGAVPISAFVNSHTGLESFADMPPPQPHGYAASSLSHQHQSQRTWAPGQPPPGGQGQGAGLGISPPQPWGIAGGAGGGTPYGGPAPAGGGALEMLPTSLPAIETRANGVPASR